jgi:TolA-binding protein
MRRAFPDRPVPRWLRRFSAEPVAALSELLAGHADLGHLQAGDGVVLLRTWMECVSDKSFTAEVDQALSEWIGQFWGDPAPAFAAGSPAVTAEAWMAAGDLIWSAGTLPSAARRMRELLPERAHFLRSLSEGLSRDPEASAWLAVANYQPDRSLLKHWWSFVNLQSTVPWYHGRLGIEGLRRLPQMPERRGRTPRELQEGLFRLGEALAVRVDEEWLAEGDGRGEFLRAARDLIGAYPSGRWMSFFRDTAARARVERYREWLGGVGLTERDLSNRQSSLQQMTRDWANKLGPISEGLRVGSTNAVKEANQLLQEQLQHALVTGDVWGYERSVGRFAHAAVSRLPDEALRWLDQGLDIAPTNAFLWSLKVNLLRQSSGAEALACSREAFRRFPDDDVIRNSLGQVLLAMKRYEEAEQVFREAMRRSPDNDVARNSLGQVLLAMKRYEEAEQVFREAMRRSPDNDVARNSLGQVLLAMKRYEEAEQVFREAMRRSPDNDVARNSLGQVLLAMKRYEEAEQVFREAMRRSPDNDVARNSLGQVLLAMKRYEEAEQVFREAMRRSPDNDVARNSLGQVLLAMKRYEEAEQVFREAMRRSPDNDVARNSLGQVLLAMKRYEEAEQVFREAMRRSPDNDVARNSLGQVLLAMKRYEEAEQVFREAMRRSPDDDVARKSLEKAQRKSIEEEPVVADVESAATGDDGPVSVDLDRVPLETNRSDESQEVAPEATQKPPSSVGGKEPREPIPESIPVRQAAIENPQAKRLQVEPVEGSPPGSVLSWRQQDLDILLTDAFFQRMWARARGVHPSPGATAGLKEMTQRLFQATTDPTAAGEYGLLEMDRNQIEEAREFLRLAVRRFPGSGRIRYAFARAEREWAAARQLRLDEDQSADVLRSWDRLPLVDARLTPVVHLGKARAWLALKDGRRVEDGAGESFSRLAAFLRPHLVSTQKDFVSNWARDTHRFVFATENVAANIDRMRERVAEGAVLLNEQEEIYVKAVCP